MGLAQVGDPQPISIINLVIPNNIYINLLKMYMPNKRFDI